MPTSLKFRLYKEAKMKFKGDYNELIEMGFEFQKLFAREYPVYHKDDVWVWVDADIEINDMLRRSDAFLRAIKDGRDIIHARYYQTVYNIATGEFEMYEPKKHDPDKVFCAENNLEYFKGLSAYLENDANLDFYTEYAKKFRKERFLQYGISDEVMAIVKTFIELGYI